MLLLADLFGHIAAVLERLLLAPLPLNRDALLLRNLLAILIRHLLALLVLLLHLPDPLNRDAVGLRQVLARFRDVSPNLVIVTLLGGNIWI